MAKANGDAAVHALQAIAELRKETAEHARRMDRGLGRVAKALGALAIETRRRLDEHENRLRELEHAHDA